MNTATLAALIASGTSLLVTIISVVSAFLNSRNSARLSKEIETLKHNLNLERQAIEEKKKINGERLTALSDAIKTIQKVKDVIQRIVGSLDKSHYSEVALRNIKAASNELIECYEENFTEFVKGKQPDEQSLFHRAKALAFKIEDYLITVLDQRRYTSDLSKEEKERLLTWRTEISDIQTQLQNSLYKQFIECNFKKISQ